MSWLSFDDGYTRQRVWDDLPYDTRWHYHAVVETCCAEHRYDGRLRWTAVNRCSDVPDPARCAKELLDAGLLRDLGDQAEVPDIDHFLPPEGQRGENLLPRKRANQREYRRRKCERGEHSRDCPAASCPVKLRRALDKTEPVTGRVAGNAGTGRDGSGRDGPAPTGGGSSDDWPAVRHCTVCGGPLDKALAAAGITSHPSCEEDR